MTPTPVNQYPSLARPFQLLEMLHDSHTSTMRRQLEAGGGIFPFDLFYGGVIQRSVCLCRGFLDAFLDWNLVVAAPLVRLQIDNLVRVSYISRHATPHQVAMEAMDTEFRRMKGPDGHPLLDHRLVKLAAPFHDWLPPVYDAASGWVHFSPLHATTPWSIEGGGKDEGAKLLGKILYQIDEYPETFLQEVLGAMEQATAEVLAYGRDWQYTKDFYRSSDQQDSAGIVKSTNRPTSRGERGTAQGSPEDHESEL